MLWRALVSKTGHLDPEIIERAWDTAERLRDDYLLATIASRAGLPDRIENAVAKHKRAAIRAARFERDGWDIDALLEALDGERADSALVLLAAKERRTAVQEALWERAERNDRATLKEALALNVTLDAEVAGKVWAFLAHRYWAGNLPGKFHHVHGLVSARTDAHASLARNMKRPGFHRVLLSSPYLDVAGAENIAHVFLDGGATAVRSNLEKICKNEHFPLGARDTVRAKVQQHDQNFGSSTLQRLLATWQVAAQPKAAAPISIRAVVSEDPDELAAIAQSAVGARAADIALQLANNGALDGRGALCVLELLRPWHEVAGRMFQIALRTHPDLFIETVAENDGWFSYAYAALSTQMRQVALDMLHTYLVENKDTARRRAWQVLAANKTLTLDELLDAPWWIVELVDDQQREQVASWVSNVLAGSQTGWDLLASLEHPTISLRELTETVDALV